MYFLDFDALGLVLIVSIRFLVVLISRKISSLFTPMAFSAFVYNITVASSLFSSCEEICKHPLLYKRIYITYQFRPSFLVSIDTFLYVDNLLSF